jgi:hypothetical protein
MQRKLLAAVFVALACGGNGATAADVTVVGPVTRIVLAPDGQSAVATLKDVRSGEEVRITVTDELTLDKFKDRRIVEGDEVRSRIEPKDGGNASKSFRKTAGC